MYRMELFNQGLADIFEGGIIQGDGTGPGGFGIPALSLPGWLMRGAIREDDLGTTFGFNNGYDPHDDPYGTFQRVFNHFFNPINNSQLTVLGVPFGLDTNPNWAIGASDAFATTLAENTSRRNHFTVYDARESMYRALTGKKKDGTDADPSASTAAQKEAMRKAYWATLFRSLGDIMHLNQDMAAPQHTRNEAHSGLGGVFSNGLSGHASFYELYIDARAMGATEFFMKDEGVQVIQLTPLVFDGFAIPSFSKYSDFWSSGQGVTSKFGTGLADYSNHNFFTPANNFGDTNFQDPPSQLSQYTPTLSPYLLANGTQIAKKYLVGNGGLPPIRMTQQSAWGKSGSPVAVYTQDRNVYDDMAALLIPRAVAYSAGILNYFFRGKMQISLPDEGVYGLLDHAANTTGFDKIKLKLSAPATDYNGQPQTLSGGKIVAVMTFRRNTCYVDDLTGFPPFVDSHENCTPATSVEELVVSNADENVNVALTSDPQAFTFNFATPLPLSATNVRLKVIYRGPSGVAPNIEADAVVVTTQNISEPTFFSYMNATDYYHLGANVLYACRDK